jgi:hypothetical protein
VSDDPLSDDPLIDRSLVDNYLRSRHRVEVLNAAWKPALAGAAGAAAIIGAVVVGVWLATPRFSYRDIEIPRIVTKDLETPRAAISPRAPSPSPEPRTPEERAFVGSPEWKGAVVRGRILRPERNGFALMTADGEQSFFPARIGPGGKVENDLSVVDEVDDLLGDLALCRKLPNATYRCAALTPGGGEVPIPVRPVGQPL